MKTKVSPAIVGAFVLGAFGLGIIALLAFGGISFFSKPQRFVVYFDESIHGLDLGSPVKLRGVRVGRVVDLTITYDEKKNASVVAVVCELSKNKLTDPKGAIINVDSRDELQKLVDHGLRAQLGVLGLATGLLFVELDFLSPQENPNPHLSDPRYLVVPSVSSSLAEFQARATDLMAKINKIDFEGLSNELKGLLVDTRRQLNSLDLKPLITQWTKTGAQVEALAASPEIKQTMTNFNAAIVDLRTTLAHVDQQVGPAGTELTATLAQARKTLESFNTTSEAARRFIAAQGTVGDDLNRTLTQLSEAAGAVQRLADFLERNPQALLTGKKRPQ
ncbi:MAG: MCE family protein [Verrucomicrobia bacterium]|nr:MCE family protein [Verrucomicrobiota bacterium]